LNGCPHASSRRCSARAPALLTAELLGRMRAELPVVGELGEREQVLVAAWLTGLRSPRTRGAYAADVAASLGWLTRRGTDVRAAGRVGRVMPRWRSPRRQVRQAVLGSAHEP
jgi:hypothetical protein